MKNIDFRQRKKPVLFYLSPLLAFFTVVSLSIIVSISDHDATMKLTSGSSFFLFTTLAKFSTAFDGSSLAYTLCLFFLSYWYSIFFLEKKKYSPLVLLLSSLFSIFYLFGLSYSAFDNWDFLFQSRYQVIQTVVLFIGLLVLFYTLIDKIYSFLDKDNNTLQNPTDFNKKKYFLTVFTLLLFFWLPTIIAFFPGSVAPDTRYQLLQYYGYRDFAADNPPFLTFFYGSIFHFGRTLFNDNLGVFLNIVVQTLICAFSFSMISTRIRTMQVPRAMSVGVILFYGVVPVWAATAQNMMKDVLHTAFFAWFMVEFIYVISNEKLKKRNYFFMLISALLTALTRKTGFYILIISFLPLLLLHYRTKLFKRTTITVCCFLFGFFAINYLLFPALGVLPASEKDTFSIPFQQTALYCKLYGDELSEEEIAIIDSVLDYDSIAKVYNSRLVDDVKDTYRGDPEKLPAFMKQWARLFFKHPDAYIQAIIANSYDYFYPETIGRGVFRLSIAEPRDNVYNLYNTSPPALRSAIKNYQALWKKLPFFYYLLNPGFYSWILFICIGQGWRKKNARILLANLPLLLLLLGCVFSPVNGETRYMLPIMATLPLMVAITMEKSSIFPIKRTFFSRNKDQIYKS